ncbi:hypothetical protein BKA62DRAFT_720974 [Auriculariales sp. MPI-PUGE-AT-0066]|nr:hypothetical protein BKA62DRAFT_720974 [Auriculariales sp. MPI-PUGE-AT-0066]
MDSDYTYDDTTVSLSIGERRFKVSRKRLTDVSPIFADMFQLPSANDDPIDLPVDIDEFRHFLWYLHVSIVEFIKWDKECTGDARFRRLLGIAAIAHVYQAPDVVAWSVAQLLPLLSSVPVRDVATVKRLYDFALRAEGVDPQLQTQCRDYWCSRVRESSDPIEWLLAAHSLNNQYLQAYAYFHILGCSGATLASDSRLTVVDRLRLLVGVTNLRRFTKPKSICACTPNRKRCSCIQCGRPVIRSYCDSCHKWEQFPVEPVSEDQAQHSSTIAPITNQPAEAPIMSDVILQDDYGTLSLWEVFTRSELGDLIGHEAETTIGMLSPLAT